jgi:rhomboid protease GluP
MALTRHALASCALALAVLVIWCTSAVRLDQSLLATQTSSALLKLGAADGNLFASGEWWRLMTSQFLHVHCLHMLFNVGCILVIGPFVERALIWYGLMIVYLVGGTAGQTASVMLYPASVSSGASQAILALCGAAIVLANSRAKLLAALVVTIQVALDLYAGSNIKMGHVVGFCVGLLIAFVLRNKLPDRGATN